MLFQTGVNNKSQNTSSVSSKPGKPKKKWRAVLKVIIIIALVKILIIITLANYFSPDNKVKRYLHAKYGSNRELSVDGVVSLVLTEGYGMMRLSGGRRLSGGG